MSLEAEDKGAAVKKAAVEKAKTRDGKVIKPGSEGVLTVGGRAVPVHNSVADASVLEKKMGGDERIEQLERTVAVMQSTIERLTERIDEYE